MLGRRQCQESGCSAHIRRDNTHGRCRKHRGSAPKFREWVRYYSKINRQKIRGYEKKYLNADPLRVRNRNLRRTFGITHTDYISLLNAQHGGCAICGRTDSGSKNSPWLFVDHCHTTGKIRGLLCHGCNAGLGSFQENPARLDQAIMYLENTSNRGSNKDRTK